MDNEARHQPKQERSRTRWTASLDKIFADLVVKQIQLGNRPNNVFDKKTWKVIREEFNNQTDLNFNNNQLRKHLDVLRTRYYNLKSSFDHNDFTIDDSYNIGFDLWEDIAAPAQPRPEKVKVKDCPIYEQLCAIFTEPEADGKYAQSSHYEELDKSAGIDSTDVNSCPDGGTTCPENPSSSAAARPMLVNQISSEMMMKIMVDRKKKRSTETRASLDQSGRGRERYVAMAEALLEMIAASKSRAVAKSPTEGRFSISNCIKVLDEIEGVDEPLYLAVLDLFEDPSLRETFMSLKGDRIRLSWLQGKCGKTTSI